MIKMNPSIKKKWIKALKSNKYTQNANLLLCEKSFKQEVIKSCKLWPFRNHGLVLIKACIEDRYSALGVLCDLHSKEFDIVWNTSYPEDKYYMIDTNKPINHKELLKNKEILVNSIKENLIKSYLGATICLPREVARWSKINNVTMNSIPAEIALIYNVKLANTKFKYLANIIEANF